MTSKERLDRTHDAFAIIRNAIRALSVVGCDLENVGNHFLAERIHVPCDELEEALQTLKDVSGEEVTAQLHQAQEFSNTILRAALAGLELGADDDN
jgi:hypothetical protein